MPLKRYFNFSERNHFCPAMHASMQITYITGHDNVGRSFLNHIPKYFLDRLCGLSVTSVYVKYCQIGCAYCIKALKTTSDDPNISIRKGNREVLHRSKAISQVSFQIKSVY